MESMIERIEFDFDDVHDPACQAVLRLVHAAIVAGRFKKSSMLLSAELARRVANFRAEIDADVLLIAVTPSRATTLVVPSDGLDLYLLAFVARTYTRSEVLQ
jgi:hypothetical protein